MTREDKEKLVEDIKKKYEVTENTNKKGFDVVSIDLGLLETPKELSNKKGIFFIRTLEDGPHLTYSISLGLNKSIKTERKKKRAERSEKRKELKSEIQVLIKKAQTAIRSKDIEAAQKFMTEIEKTENQLAAF